MGVYYYYANVDKRQYFRTGLFSWSDRFAAIGRGPGARVLAILLSDRGTWRRDRISVVADTSEECQELYTNYVDIAVEAQLMLIDVDGLAWIEDEFERGGSSVFSTMCAFAILLGRNDIQEMLEKRFGVNEWRQRYRQDLDRNADYWSQGIIEAKKRSLKILI